MTMLRCVMMLMVVLASRAEGGSVIELHSSARPDPTRAVTLADVARLTGPEAEALATVEVLPALPASSDAARRLLTVEELRSILHADGRVNWGRVMLRGQRCVILPPSATVAAPVPAPAPAVSSASTATGTVRQAVVARIASIAGASPERVRVEFDARDEEFLATPTAGRTIEVNPGGTSDRLPLAVAIYERDRTVASRTIRVRVEVLRAMFRTRDAMPRGESIGVDGLEAAEQWMPLTAAPATREHLEGALTQGAVRAGQIVMASDVAPALAVNKGEIVSVRVLSGSVVLSTRARAMARARDGELVRLQALDSPREFLARMDGRQRAIVVAGETPTLPESPRNGRDRARVATARPLAGETR